MNEWEKRIESEIMKLPKQVLLSMAAYWDQEVGPYTFLGMSTADLARLLVPVLKKRDFLRFSSSERNLKTEFSAPVERTGPDAECATCGASYFSADDHPEVAMCRPCWLGDGR